MLILVCTGCVDLPEGFTDGSCLVDISVGLNKRSVAVCWFVMFWVVLALACEVDVWGGGCVVFKVVGRVVVWKPGKSDSLLVKSCCRLLVFSLAISIQDISEAVDVGAFS